MHGEPCQARRRHVVRAGPYSLTVKIRQTAIGVGIVALLSASPAFAELGAQNQAQGTTISACPSMATLLYDAMPDETHTPCMAVVIFEPGVAPADQPDVVRGVGARFRLGIGLINGASVFVPNEAALRGLLNNPSVQDIRPDGRARIMAPPGACSPWPGCKDDDGTGDDGSDVGSQIEPAGYLRIGAHLVNESGADIGVAIVDTGVDLDHPDLIANIANLAGDCFHGEYVSCDDDHGHGTHVAGTVAAVDNAQDIIGVAPKALIYAVKVLDSNGGGLHSDVLAGLSWIYEYNGGGNRETNNPLPISVVNMSLGDEIVCGSSEPVVDPGYLEATNLLAAQGVVVVAAAGNDSSKEISDMVPAGCPDVLAVASTTAQQGVSGCRWFDDIPADVASYFTTDGAGVAISAPGETQEDVSCGKIKSVGILSLAKGGGTAEMSGTSMAAPHVAGVAALMLEADDTLSPGKVRENIANSADRCDEAPLDHILVDQTFDGKLEGILDAPAAVSGIVTCP